MRYQKRAKSSTIYNLWFVPLLSRGLSLPIPHSRGLSPDKPPLTQTTKTGLSGNRPGVEWAEKDLGENFMETI